MPQNNLDIAVLHLIQGDDADITACVERLYLSGDIDDAELCGCVGWLIDLVAYNRIIEKREKQAYY